MGPEGGWLKAWNKRAGAWGGCLRAWAWRGRTVGHDRDWLWWLILGPPMVAHNIELPRRMSYCALNNSYYGEVKCHTIWGVKSNGTNGSNGSNGSITLVRAWYFSNVVFHSLFKNVLRFFLVDGVFNLRISSVFDYFFCWKIHGRM